MVTIDLPKTKNELISQFRAYFDSIVGKEIPTIVSNGYFVQDLSSESGKLAESLFEGWLVSRGIEYKAEPNGPRTFPDFVVKLSEGDVNIELKEESTDTKTQGKTCNRLLKASECLRAIAKENFFDTTVLTLYKSTGTGTAVFSKMDENTMFSLLRAGGKWGVGYDSQNDNITRAGSLPFASEAHFVTTLLTIIVPELRRKNRNVPEAELAAVKERYLLTSPDLSSF